jgi:hypothetical protein
MDDLRKLAADVLGRAALEERFGHPRLSAVDIVLLHKTACADQELLKVAVSLGGRSSLRVYENLGGTYETKEAWRTADGKEERRGGHSLAEGVGAVAGHVYKGLKEHGELLKNEGKRVGSFVKELPSAKAVGKAVEPHLKDLKKGYEEGHQ